MPWYNVVAYFAGGAFLANFVPHFTAGISGNPFYSPFAKPPFRGLSSPRVNILWGLVNLAASYTLLVIVGDLEPRSVASVAIAGAGFALASIGIAGSIGRIRAGSR
jgi:hypothetical protein